MIIAYAVLLSVAFLFFTRFYKIIYKYFKNRAILRKIPAPPAQFLLGHLYLLRKFPSNTFFNDLRHICSKYGPIFRFSGPFFTLVNLMDPKDIEVVLSNTKHITKSRIYGLLKNWLGTGLLTSTGSKWHKRRKILTPAFHFSVLKSFIEVFNEEAAKLVKIIEEKCLSEEEIIDVVPHVTNFTLQSIAETAMGIVSIDNETKIKYKNALLKMSEIFLERFSRPSLRVNLIYRFSQLARNEAECLRILHGFSYNIIKQRENAASLTICLKNYTDNKRLAMLDLLLKAKNEGVDIGFDGIREEVDTFMFEGHDTTAMAISFILLSFANLPDIQAKILEEILCKVGPLEDPNINQLQNLKYTEMCIKECLRLFPSVPFMSRRAGEDFTTPSGYFIPKGSTVHVHIFDVHRDPKIYPDPLKFDPERFLSENVNQRHPFAYIPFSAGPRNCIGQKFAMLELKAVICGLLRKFRLEKVDDMHKVKFKLDLVLRPQQAVRVKFVLRQNQKNCFANGKL